MRTAIAPFTLAAVLMGGLSACSSPPTPAGALVDRLTDTAVEVITAPSDSQKAHYKTELISRFNALGMGDASGGISEGEWTAVIGGAVDTCKKLASGTSMPDMRLLMIQETEETYPNISPDLRAGLADAYLSAATAPDSICPQ